jgi:hypothetical protein
MLFSIPDLSAYFEMIQRRPGTEIGAPFRLMKSLSVMFGALIRSCLSGR